MKTRLIIIGVILMLLAGILGACGVSYKTFAIEEDNWRYEFVEFLKEVGESFDQIAILNHPLFTFEYPRSYHTSDAKRSGSDATDMTITEVIFARHPLRNNLNEPAPRPEGRGFRAAGMIYPPLNAFVVGCTS